ncbi:transcription termination factor 5, mitochondrial [Bacillus rossius redtenbacheri]|uniref:transcription termination factor 5, mitochondrial n=1 Tax=Bacillus rossius redtenbacheri TaxID=93214 RepID=UPI002FDDFCD7
MFARYCRWLFVGPGHFRDACRCLYTSSRTSSNINSGVAHVQINFLINKLGLPVAQAEEFVKGQKSQPDVSPERLDKALDMLLGLGFTLGEVQACPEVVLVKPATIQHRTLLLQEAGAPKVTPRCVVSYLVLARMRVTLLKAYGLIPPHVDVASSMLSHLGDGPGPLASPGEDATLAATQVAVLRHYLAWRLALAPHELERVMRTYTRVRNKSLRLISRTLAVLQDELGFSRDKIKNNGYLIHSHPDNTLRTLREVPHIRGVPFKDIVLLHPKIVMTPTDTLLTTLRYLEEFGIKDESVRRNPEVFTLGSESVRARLEQIRTQPGLSGLQGHPRVLRLVQYIRKARKRLDTLQDLRVRCASLHVLCGTQARFEGYTRDGADRTRGVDAVHYLSRALGCDGEDARARLRRHPYWYHVPLETIRQTCELLLGRGFCPRDVLRNVHLLLYSRERVLAELEGLGQRPELRADVFLTATGGSEPSRSQQLALCLYFLEREHHFTGDGVWAGLPPAPLAAA